ncbi:MAG: acetyl-CoA carboxylase biotin carboxyl carrier protein [Pseudomonadota bacterium]
MAEKKTSSPSVEAQWIRELATILQDTGLTEIELEQNDMKLRVARQVAPMAMSVPAPAPMAAPAPTPASASAPTSAPAPTSALAPSADVPAGAVKSPMVGTVYLAPSPGAPNFVKMGDTVQEGQTIMIVEAMKTMNPITAPQSGKVTAILVGDTQPVEFDEPLLVIA